MVPTGENSENCRPLPQKDRRRRLRTMKVKSHGDIFVLLLEFAGLPVFFAGIQVWKIPRSVALFQQTVERWRHAGRVE